MGNLLLLRISVRPRPLLRNNISPARKKKPQRRFASQALSHPAACAYICPTGFNARA
jgi:hypothetical protein